MPLHDLSFAVRTLRRSPVFTLAAVLTIALGIGATTAIFSVALAVSARIAGHARPSRTTADGRLHPVTRAGR
jgi:hypothetical protein